MLFGGEPLLVPIADLEELWRWGLEKYGRNRVQTNGALINDEHVRLFRQYKVDVGISIDGPGELNDARWDGSLEKTRAATARAEAAIERLCREVDAAGPDRHAAPGQRRRATSCRRCTPGCGGSTRWASPACACTCWRWTRPASAQLHALSPRENVEALRASPICRGELPRIRFDLFAGDGAAAHRRRPAAPRACGSACDPYDTRAVQGRRGQRPVAATAGAPTRTASTSPRPTRRASSATWPSTARRRRTAAARAAASS